jgi:flagellin-specific chaperone FliS
VYIEAIQSQLTELNDLAVNALKNEDAEAACEHLKRCEQILENLTSEGRDVDRNQIIIVLHNLA